MGRALPAVGLTPGQTVTEGQMRNLFGEGRQSRGVAQQLGSSVREWNAMASASNFTTGGGTVGETVLRSSELT
jgi:hypothetical protein